MSNVRRILTEMDESHECTDCLINGNNFVKHKKDKATSKAHSFSSNFFENFFEIVEDEDEESWDIEIEELKFCSGIKKLVEVFNQICVICLDEEEPSVYAFWSMR